MNTKHDKIATRLAIILTKLNNGERLSIDSLADEFNVAKRTIQRDLNERFSYLPIKKENSYYFLEEYCLGKLNYGDIKSFASLSGIKNLYPNLDDSFIVDLLNSKINQTYLIKGYEYEDLSSKTKLFELINIAIITNQTINLTYNDKQRALNPYKLINTDGIWYLSADENNQLKTYTVSKISNLTTTSKTFKPNKEFEDIITQNQDTWFSEDATEVTLQIDKKVKEYFIRRELLPHQKIIKQDDNLILTTTVSYEDEILKIVRYWMPHIKILQPTYLQDKLLKDLKTYIDS
ncbi:MAG: transcriptional regulator [Epsilonproteobacteria bacterium]|nr:MAG: transcriptional regulator [Campylobacterota bacterium]